MNTNPNDGAYPASVRKLENYMDEGGYGRTRTITVQGGGLTKREYFAALAMQGMLASWPKDARLKPDTTAERATLFADALIAALNAEPQS